MTRKLYFEAHDIIKKAGMSEHSRWFCQNPDCKAIHQLYELEIHHLIPRAIAPSLTYDVNNMILLCQKCHREIEQNQERKRKIKHPYKQMVFCRYCGRVIDFKRDRINSEYFHPQCFNEFARTPDFITFLNEIKEDLQNEKNT